MKATLSNYRQSPRKVRLITELVKGKSIADAFTALTFSDKRASAPIEKLLRSAVANAEQAGESLNELVVENIAVDKGRVAKTYMPRAFGRASTIRKRSSHVTVTLGKAKPKTARHTKARSAGQKKA